MWKKIGKILLKILLILIAITVLMTIVYRWVNPPITPLMVSRAVFDGYPIKKKWIPIEDMPQSLLNCVVASEDNFFLSHYGIDFGAVEKAIEYNKKHKKTRGASTVSQQTAKNVFLWQGRSWLRKGLEAYFTFLIETFWSKQRIMEVYLNSIEMGDGIYGVQACAEKNFDVDARNLTRSDCALIAATLPNPRRFSSKAPGPYMRKRLRQIETQMKHIPAFPSDK